MTYFTNGIKLLIDQNEISQATDELLTILKYGKKEIHQQAADITKPMLPKHRNRAKITKHASPSPLNLQLFLAQLEKDELPMVRFLSHIELGEEKIKKGEWKEAKINFELARSVHQPSFRLSKREIETRISLCDDAINFNRFVDQGNNHFLNGDWENAIRAFMRTLDLTREDFGVDVSQIQSVIAICSQGIHFNKLIDKARDLKHQRKWAEACDLLKKAKDIHRDEFYTSSDSIEKDIIICQNKATSNDSLLSAIFEKISMERPYFTLSLIIGLIVTLFGIFYFFSEPYSTQNLAHSQTESKVEAKKKPTYSAQKEDPMKEEQIVQHEPSSEEFNAEAQLKEKVEVQSNHETALIQTAATKPIDPPVFSNTPTPDEIQELTKAESHATQVVEKDLETPTLEELSTIEYEAGKVAIVPFCNGLEDQNLASKIYKDASFAIRATGNSGIKTVSQTLVKGKIQELGLGNENFCSKSQAMAIAQSLGAENIITGNIIQLPDDQTRIICEVLHVPTGEYKQEIVITEADPKKLRNNLKKEISKIFN